LNFFYHLVGFFYGFYFLGYVVHISRPVYLIRILMSLSTWSGSEAWTIVCGVSYGPHFPLIVHDGLSSYFVGPASRFTIVAMFFPVGTVNAIGFPAKSDIIVSYISG